MAKFNCSFGEVDKAISIMKEVAQWRHDISRTVWLPESMTKENLMRGLKPENFYVGYVDGEEACSMILQWHDSLFWPLAKENEAGYIHKLCTRKEFAGKKLSKLMVNLAIEECLKRGIHYLRLDTGWNNTRLCELYESHGFIKVEKFMLGDRPFALFEMKFD